MEISIPVWSCTLTRRPLADNWQLKMKAPTQLDGSRWPEETHAHGATAAAQTNDERRPQNQYFRTLTHPRFHSFRPK